MDCREDRALSNQDMFTTARTYERMANDLLQLRNEAKALGDEKLRLALEHAYLEAIATRHPHEPGFDASR